MQSPYSRTIPAAVAAIAILGLDAVLLADPGFGSIRKRKINLQVRRPAVVRLTNTTIAFRGGATSPQYQPVVPTLQATLETELVSNDRTLVKRPQPEAAWTLDVRVTGFSLPQGQRRQQAVPNGQPMMFVRYSGRLNVAYQVIEKGGRVHDAGNVTASYNQEFDAASSVQQGKPLLGFIPTLKRAPGTAPRSEEDVKQILVLDVVQKIATNLGNTVQPIEVQVAGGDDRLNRAADFMDNRLWARAIEELEKTPAFPKAAHEAYRIYNLGLAHEAMSYESRTYQEQRANLTKAQTLYDQAAEMNREERYFVEVIGRIRDSFARYRELDAMDRDDRRKAAAPARPALTPPPPASAPVVTTATSTPAARASTAVATAPSGKPLTAKNVIDMLAAKVPRAQILEIVKNSKPAYDLLDPATAIALNQAQVPAEIMSEMRRKVGLSSTPAGTPAPAASPAKPK
jgi:hypothetical protein